MLITIGAYQTALGVGNKNKKYNCHLAVVTEFSFRCCLSIYHSVN